jgi:hypothetical protein
MTIHDPNPNGLGKIEVKTLSLPEWAKPQSATYTYSGTVLLSYGKDVGSDDLDYQNIAVLNDDGTCFRNIFSGSIKKHPKANGIRYMVFEDNKRILLGDHVLECVPDIDTCENAKLVPVEYPAELVDDPATMKHWSEIIIAPDNEHISWTTLRSDGNGAAVLIGKLTRRKDRYTIDDTKIISTLEFMQDDPQRSGFLIPRTVRGGEVKQFIRGGTAISLAGSAEGSCLTDSVVQDLRSEKIERITNTPGYDETTIFSPDERLGMVMSSRASPKTDPAIFGLIPRPFYTVQGMIMCLYMYAVAGVRKFRKGNIGPILIDIERSRFDKDYRGMALNDPDEQWVYCSPMSWHPGSKKTMWPEVLRGTGEMRIRIAELPDYRPGPTVAVQKTPDHIPYAERDISKLQVPAVSGIKGKIAGKHSGYIEFNKQGKEDMPAIVGFTEAVYVSFSDDGKRFYNGYEKTVYSVFAESAYEADLIISGAEQGEMKFRTVFSKIAGNEPRLLFEKAPDGKPKSCGYASYKGITFHIEDMRE